MAKLSKSLKPELIPIILHRKINEMMANNLPRRCILISMSLCLAGICIPFLMTLHLLPVTLLINFVGYMLALFGGVMLLILYGDI